MSIVNLARPAVRNLRAYVAGSQQSDSIRLNANEFPGAGAELNRYPEVRPADLTRQLAKRFNVPETSLLVTRGSSEAIDLLIRSFCSEGRDRIVVTAPSFEMYRVYADIQGAGIIDVPLPPEHNFRLESDHLLDQCDERCKIIFLCSPNNPTGSEVPRKTIRAIAGARRNRSIVVIDEAYIEFSESESVVDLVTEFDNLVVLRTLSKALALAGARCGAIIGDARLISMLDGVLPPYAMSKPVIDCILHALTKRHVDRCASGIADIVAERKRLSEALATNPLVENVWPSSANFLLVRFHDLALAGATLKSDRVLIRRFDADSSLTGCARITVGHRSENDRLLQSLASGASR